MRKFNKNKKGLTLIEVLLAIIILSIGVSVLMISTTKCLSVIHAAKNREIAQNLLRQMEVNFPIEKIDLDELSESGEFEQHQNFSWNRNILMVDEENRPGLFLIQTRINWTERGKNSFEEITLYTYAPEAESVSKEL